MTTNLKLYTWLLVRAADAHERYARALRDESSTEEWRALARHRSIEADKLVRRQEARLRAMGLLS